MTRPRSNRVRRWVCLAAAAAVPAALVAVPAWAPAADDAVRSAEAARVAVIAKVSPAVVCVCSYGGGVVGSGILISPDGYVLTNYHVAESISPVMQGGLNDGKLYDGVIVGQDKVGDVALFKLLPKKDGSPFSFVPLGDSDKTKAGDWSMAMGNPFGLSLDFTPTVTFGLVSGINRFQPPEGKGMLEYTDCIQIETSINPGNSGGPLFNMAGELIGINGRGSFEKRGRVNSGVGYAISINQIKNFLGLLKAGVDADHATLGATVGSASEDGDLSVMTVKQVLDDPPSDAFRRGIQAGDQVISFAGRPMTSVNQYKNVLGIYPKDWRLPIAYRRDNARKETLVRLMGHMDKEVNESDAAPKPPTPPRPQRPDPLAQKAKLSPAMKLFKEKKGFANYYFNELERDRLLAGFRTGGDFSSLTGPWTIIGQADRGDRKGDIQFRIENDEKGQTVVTLRFADVVDKLVPLDATNNASQLKLPIGSGGLLVAMYEYRRLLVLGPKGFEGGFYHAGVEPFYPPPPQGMPAENLAALRVDCEVVRARHAAIETKFYFSKSDQTLLGFETFPVKDDDPCEVYFSDYRPENGRKLPHRLDVYYSGKRYGVFSVAGYKLDQK
ncbi:MAG TPA: trypsin-like peptidase domain-containing protein [Fimbriiglobus sp.]